MVRQLNRLTIDVDNAQTLCKHIPENSRKYIEWESQACVWVEKAKGLARNITKSFEGMARKEYTDDEVLEEFISSPQIEEVKAELPRQALIGGQKLAEDAARDFAWWQKIADDVGTLGVVGTVGCGGVGACVVPCTAVIAVALITGELCYKYVKSAQYNDVKIHLRDKAVLLASLTEIMEKDVRVLNEISVYLDEIFRRKMKVESKKKLGHLEADLILDKAKLLMGACEKYFQLKGRKTETE